MLVNVVEAGFGERVFGGVEDTMPVNQERGDVFLGVEDGAASGFGGVRGEHGGDLRVFQQLGYVVGADSGLGGGEFRGGGFQGGVGGRQAGFPVSNVVGVVVEVFDKVGEEGKVVEGPGYGEEVAGGVVAE